MLGCPLAAAGQIPQAPPQEEEGPPRPEKPKKAPRKSEPLLVASDWQTHLPSPPGAVPAYDQHAAYVAMRSGQFAAIALGNGKIAWTIDAATRPTGEGQAKAAEAVQTLKPAEAASTAKPAEPGQLPKPAEAVAAPKPEPAPAAPDVLPPATEWVAPAAGGGLVFVATPRRIEGRDAATGQLRWEAAIDEPLVAPLVWENGWLLAVGEQGTATMLRATTGERLWGRSLGANVRPGAAMTGDRIYLPLENGRVAAVALTTGAPIWERQLPGRPGAIAPLDDRIFVGADDKYFYCLSAKNGKRKWRWRTGGTSVGVPAIDDKNVYFLSMDNVLRALARGDGHQVWHAGVPMRPASGPFLTGRLLVVAGVASEIRAYHVVDGSEAGTSDMPGDLVAPPHFLALRGQEVSPFVAVTGEGLIVRFVPTAPPLPSKPFPATPVPLLPAAGDSPGPGVTDPA